MLRRCSTRITCDGAPRRVVQQNPFVAQSATLRVQIETSSGVAHPHWLLRHRAVAVTPTHQHHRQLQATVRAKQLPQTKVATQRIWDAALGIRQMRQRLRACSEESSNSQASCLIFGVEAEQHVKEQSAHLREIMMSKDCQARSYQIIKQAVDIISQTEMQSLDLHLRSVPEWFCNVTPQIRTCLNANIRQGGTQAMRRGRPAAVTRMLKKCVTSFYPSALQ